MIFKYRVHDPRIAKFLSVDPLAPEYPWNSPYAFAENRVIDGADLEGREWDKKTDEQGKTTVITSNLDFSISTDAPSFINWELYKETINNKFNEIIQDASGGSVSGEITFEKSNVVNQLVPSLTVTKQGKVIKVIGGKDLYAAGQTTGNHASIPILDRHGVVRSPEEYALTVIHEILHTARIEHPFSVTQSKDTELVKVGPNDFITTKNTDKGISQNIMMYNSKTIDGYSLENETLDKITPGQLNVLENEINRQKSGEGTNGKFMPGGYYDHQSETREGTNVEKILWN